MCAAVADIPEEPNKKVHACPNGRQRRLYQQRRVRAETVKKFNVVRGDQRSLRWSSEKGLCARLLVAALCLLLDSSTMGVMGGTTCNLLLLDVCRCGAAGRSMLEKSEKGDRRSAMELFSENSEAMSLFRRRL